MRQIGGRKSKFSSDEQRTDMALKSLIKKILPVRVTAGIGTFLVSRRERRLGRLPISAAFDEVYKRGMWRQGASLSGVGSEGLMAERYIDLVREYAAQHNLRTVLDGGCGDFSVGSQLAPNFTRYTAVDVSPHIIEINRQRFVDQRWAHVTFAVADMTRTAFPEADLVLIRQVLQHLTNAQIEMILNGLERGIWRRALISESVHNPENNQLPNLDLPSHSVRTRTSLGSGVFIDRPPFSRLAKRIATIYSSVDGARQSGGLLVLELSRDA
jgi:SAM-dependent methyltransferase